MHSFNGATCSLINFVNYTTNGEEKEEMPKWKGTLKIIDAIQNLSVPIETIKEEYEKVFKLNEYITLESKAEDYKTNQIDTFSSLYKSEMNYDNSKEIYPLFMNGFKNSKSDYIVRITNEYTDFIMNAIINTKDLDAVTTNISNAANLNQTLVHYQKEFKNMDTTLTSIITTLIDNLSKVRDKSLNIFILTYRVIYGIFVTLSVSIITILSIYSFAKCSKLKLSLIILWNISIFICVVSIGIGAILGIVSYGFNAFSPVFVSFLTKEYLEEPSSFFSQSDDEAQYIDVCINKLGDLSQSFNVSSSTSKYFESFNTISRRVQHLASIIPEESIVYQSILSSLDIYKKDISKSTINRYNI